MENIRDYINPIIDAISSTWLYILVSIGQKWGRTPRLVQYFFLFLVAYLVLLSFLHKIYRFFVASSLKQKSKFYLVCDNVLYKFQYQNISDPKDISWIKDILDSSSYDKSYELFLEKLSMSDLPDFQNLTLQLKKTYSLYKNSNRRKTYFGFFLMIFTFGVYKLFLEN